MTSGIPSNRVLRPSRRAITAWTLVGALLGTLVAYAFLLRLTQKRPCAAVLTWSVQRFTVVDESTGREICDATILCESNGGMAILDPWDSSGARPAVSRLSPERGSVCSYEIQLNNLEHPVTVTVSHKGHIPKTVTLPEDEECFPKFHEFPSEIALTRANG